MSSNGSWFAFARATLLVLVVSTMVSSLSFSATNRVIFGASVRFGYSYSKLVERLRMALEWMRA